VDADGSIQAETVAGLPGEHVGDGVVVEEATTLEVEQDAALQGALKAVDIVGAEVHRPVEDDGAVVAPGEDAVEYDDVEVEVRIERGAEAVQEGDAAEGARRSSGAPGTRRSGFRATLQSDAAGRQQRRSLPPNIRHCLPLPKRPDYLCRAYRRVQSNPFPPGSRMASDQSSSTPDPQRGQVQDASVERAPAGAQDHTEAALRLDAERFRHLADNIREVFFILSPATGRMEYISPAYDEVWGRPGSELYERPQVWMESVLAEDRERVGGVFARSLQGLQTDMEYRIVRSDGQMRWLHARSFPVRDAAGRCIRVVGIAEDISARVEKERALKETSDLLDLALIAAEERAAENAALTEFLDVLQACQTIEEVYRIVADSLPALLDASKGALGLIAPSRNIVEVFAEWGDTPGTRRTFEPHECWGLRRGKLNWVADSRSATRCAHVNAPVGSYLCVPLAAQGETIGVLYIEGASAPEGATPPVGYGEPLCRKASSVSERMSLTIANIRLRDALRAQSIRDPLTGLFNRRYLEESLEREVRRAHRNDDCVAVIMLDLDRFKQFNDTFGHEGGDAALRAMGSFLGEHTRGQDVACRYGGEEFALILSGASIEAASARAENLQRDLKELVLRHAGQVMGQITVSMGVAAYPGHDTAAGLVRAADEALYRAKAEGRARYIVAG
jgi:diguanylate cyclase (GGDEF)-like protein/PAS domain S-box-containing protein